MRLGCEVLQCRGIETEIGNGARDIYCAGEFEGLAVVFGFGGYEFVHAFFNAVGYFQKQEHPLFERHTAPCGECGFCGFCCQLNIGTV